MHELFIEFYIVQKNFNKIIYFPKSYSLDQLVPVPSLFFIGENGTPLEIIAGSTTASDLATKIDLVLTKVGKNKNASINLIDAEQKAAETSINSNVKIEEDKKDDNIVESNIEVSLAQSTPENESNNIIKDDIKEKPSTSLKEPSKSVNETKETSTKELTPEV